MVQKNDGFREPFLLCGIPQQQVDRIVESMEGVRCPLLDERDHRLIYHSRPLACRLEGIPMIDSADGPFSDWRELNFREGLNTQLESELRPDFYGIQASERQAAERLSDYLLGRRQEEATVFIPSIIASFNTFWEKQLKRLAGF
jgi:Fe-S-cluster containining protein